MKQKIEGARGAYVLSHPVRFAIIKLLRAEGETYTSKIAEKLGINNRLVAFHLSMLATGGFVDSEYRLTNPGNPPRVARYYRLTSEVAKTLEKFVAELK